VIGDVFSAQVVQKNQFGPGLFAIALKQQGCAFTQRGLHMRMQRLGKMQSRGLPPAHMPRKTLAGQFRHRHSPLGFKLRALDLVPERKAFEHAFTTPAQHLAAPLHEFGNLGAVQKLQKILVGAETTRNPEQTDEAPVKRQMKFQTNTHADAGDFRCAQNFARCLGLHPVFIGNSKGTHPLDPCVHDQVGGCFAALGIGVIHMVVKSELIPAFGHFRQMIARKHAAHHARRSLHGATKIVRQLELLKLVAVGAHHALHDLHEGARGVATQGRMGAVEHFIIQGLEGKQAVASLCTACLKVPQQVYNGISHARNRRCHQFLDAVRVQAGIKKKCVRLFAIGFQNTVDQSQDVPVLLVKINTLHLRAHGGSPFCRFPFSQIHWGNDRQGTVPAYLCGLLLAKGRSQDGCGRGDAARKLLVTE
jgi:hypothetical protein